MNSLGEAGGLNGVGVSAPSRGEALVRLVQCGRDGGVALAASPRRAAPPTCQSGEPG